MAGNVGAVWCQPEVQWPPHLFSICVCHCILRWVGAGGPSIQISHPSCRRRNYIHTCVSLNGSHHLWLHICIHHSSGSSLSVCFIHVSASLLHFPLVHCKEEKDIPLDESGCFQCVAPFPGIFLFSCLTTAFSQHCHPKQTTPSVKALGLPSQACCLRLALLRMRGRGCFDMRA